MGAFIKKKHKLVKDFFDISETHFLSRKSDEYYTELEIDDFADGSHSGLMFMIGCLTYTRMIRSSYRSKDELQIEDYPIQDFTDYKSLESIRISPTLGVNARGSDLPSVAGKYFAEFRVENAEFYKVLNLGRRMLLEGESDPASRRVFSEGYIDGLAFGLQMYLPQQIIELEN